MSDLLDIEQVTRIRQERENGRSVLATRFPPYGHGLEPNATVIHRVKGVRVDFRADQSADCLAVWECGQSTQHPTFLFELRAPCKRKCKKCFSSKSILRR